MRNNDGIQKYSPLWGEWTIEEPVGIGSYGKVYKISKQLGNEKVISAVKHIKIPTTAQYEDAMLSLGNNQETMNIYFKDIVNKNLYLLESNHDIEMLSHGPYPEWLKSRVISDEGHLSNQSAGFYLSKLIGNNTKEVVLMHLSEVNNTESIALATINDVLREYNIDFKNITCAKQNENGEVIEV